MMLGALALLLAGGPALPVEACPREVVQPERRFSGIYVDDFEGQRFFEGAKTLADVDLKARPWVWFAPDIVAHGAKFGIQRRRLGDAYRLVFRGVKRTRASRVPVCGYGHMSVFEAEIGLTRLERIERLGSMR